MEITCNLTVPWEYGLHIRPTTKIVQILKKMDLNAYFVVKDRKYDAKKAMELLSMEAYYGEILEFHAIGNDAEKAVEKIIELFEESSEENHLSAY